MREIKMLIKVVACSYRNLEHPDTDGGTIGAILFN
jgi:hypothetical protein